MRKQKEIKFVLGIFAITILCLSIFISNDVVNLKKNNIDLEDHKINQDLIDSNFEYSLNTNLISEKEDDYEQNIRNISPKSALFNPIPTNNDIREGYALFTGVSDYPGTSNDLEYCDDDVEDLFNFVQNEFCIPEENTIRLINSGCTKSNIEEAISEIGNVMDENDFLFFSYSGHGSAEISSTQYTWDIESSHPYSNYMDQYWHYSHPGAELMRVHFTRIDVEAGYDGVFVGDNDERIYAYDLFTGSYDNVWSNWVFCDDIYVNLWTDESITDWGFEVDKVEVGYWVEPYNIIPYDGLDDGLTGSELDTMFDQIPGTSVILLDSCFSGGVGNDLRDSNRYILTASRDNEFSLEDPSNQNGLFSYQFLNVWESSLDNNLDNSLTFQEIFPQLETNTISRSGSLGFTHHPQEFDEVNHDITFRPSANINFLIESFENNIELNYSLRGLGENRLAMSAYDIDIQNFTLLSEIPEISQTRFCNIIDMTIDNNIDGLTCSISVKYHEFIESSNSSLELSPISFNEQSDFDNDGFSDLYEYYNAMNPWSNDTDEDGMDDEYEILNDLNPWLDDSLIDSDRDYLSNLQEYQIGTDPQNPDCDDDEIYDGWEYIWGLNPFNNTDSLLDFDDDGLNNLVEFQYEGNPNENDTDLDGLSDLQEYFLGLSLNNTDSDDDGINDADEDYDLDEISNIDEYQIGTDPMYNDSDEDGCLDGWEINYDLNPLNETDAFLDLDGDGLSNLIEFQNSGNPTEIDTDEDGLTDYQEFQLGTSLNDTDSDNDGINDPDEDYDLDGISNIDEIQLGTDPLYYDTDKDGCSDGWELIYGFNPLDYTDGLLDSDGDGLLNYLEYRNDGDPTVVDTDGDALTDYEEFVIGTLLNNTDSDGDGYSDKYEVNFNTDPLDPNKTPVKNRIIPGVFASFIPIGIIVSVIIRKKKKV